MLDPVFVGYPRTGGERSVVAYNVLDRPLQADGPNQKWVADWHVLKKAEPRANSSCSP